MLRAIELAQRGAGNVAPNPMVGCVIVHNNQIIGEGWHRNYGGPHAEVHAIQSVMDKTLLTQSELFVTLEPCSHFGKTPPCADLIVTSGIPSVHVACLDPNPLVAGKGIDKLKSAGISVDIGMCETEAYFMNRRFFTSIKQNRPYIRLKWAMSLDGFLDKHRSADETGSFRISGDAARRLSHKWRTEEAAILIGSRTAQIDNPELTARFWPGESPTRILIDPNLKVSENAKIFNQKTTTLVYNFVLNKIVVNIEYIKIEPLNFISLILSDLHNRKIQSLIVEGGANTLQRFIDGNYWDEVSVFQSNIKIEKGLLAPEIPTGNKIKEKIGNDLLIQTYREI